VVTCPATTLRAANRPRRLATGRCERAAAGLTLVIKEQELPGRIHVVLIRQPVV